MALKLIPTFLNLFSRGFKRVGIVLYKCLLPLELHSRRELYPFAVAGNLDSRAGTLLEGIDAILGIIG